VNQFLKTTQILPVNDIYETTSWYEKVLGLKTVYLHGEGRRGEVEDFCNYAIMVRDAVEVHFILDEGEHVWTRSGTGHLGVTVADVVSLFDDVQRTEAYLGTRTEGIGRRVDSSSTIKRQRIHIEQPD
jgi:catechol 2,3-dioxygenase-like lactoylglutathione lyase family enzyme